MKSNPLAAALAAKQQAPASRVEPSAGPRHPARPGKRQVSVYLPIPVHEYLRKLAFESRCSMHSLLMGGVDRMLGEQGTSIAQLTKEGKRA